MVNLSISNLFRHHHHEYLLRLPGEPGSADSPLFPEENLWHKWHRFLRTRCATCHATNIKKVLITLFRAGKTQIPNSTGDNKLVDVASLVTDQWVGLELASM